MTDRGSDNHAQLIADERWARRRLAGLATPAGLLVLFILFVPMGWILWFSAVGADGMPTIENYARMLEGTSHLNIFRTTFEISLVVTGICLLLAYPLSYTLAQIPRRVSNLLMIAVLLPYWTSILVRTYAWLILLQRNGLINQGLIDLGVIGEPLALAHNFFGVVVGMVHIMLPFLVLPLYASMRAIDPDYLRAASILGAPPSRAFWTVYFPMSVPGMLAGVLLVFVLCLGFFVTPAVLGGGKVIMIAQSIEQTIAVYANWGAASALGVVLLVLTLGFLYVGTRLVRMPRGFGV